MSSEFKHPGGWSVSLSSPPVCLHNLQISKAWGRSASLWRPSIQVFGLLQAAFSTQHFTLCNPPQSAYPSSSFESAFYPTKHQISVLPLLYENNDSISKCCNGKYRETYFCCKIFRGRRYHQIKSAIPRLGP